MGSSGSRLSAPVPKPKQPTPDDRQPALSDSSNGTAPSPAETRTSLLALAGPAFRLSGTAVQRQSGAGATEPAGDTISQAVQLGLQTAPSAFPHRDQIQAAFGQHDISRADAHFGSAAAASAHSLNARAYTVGDHVVFAGQPDLHTAAHEATHIVQQRGGVQLAGGLSRKGDPYEQHADAVADRVVAGRSASDLLDRPGPAQQVVVSRLSPAVQREEGDQPGQTPISLPRQAAVRISTGWAEAGLSEFTIKDLLVSQLVTEAVTNLPAGPTTPMNLIRLTIESAYNRNIFAAAQDLKDVKDLIRGEIQAQFLMQGIVGVTEQDALDAWNDTWLIEANHALHHYAHNSGASPEMEDIMRYANYAGNDLMADLAQSFLKLHPEDKAEFTALSPQEAVRLNEALKRMPTVQAILSGGIDKITHERVERAAEEAPDVMKWLAPDISGEGINEKVVETVNLAMRQIINMVHPAMLARLPVPKVVVHKNPGKLEALRNWRLSDLAGFRAFSNRTHQEIHIAANEPVEVIVHEIGHQLEYFLPSKHWLDIQSLLRSRHKASGNGTLTAIYPWSPDSDMRKEAAYQADMPATGAYSAKFYATGNTEVMSMSMEYFSRPETALKLLDSDPLQAAIILRAIQPHEYDHYVPEDLRDRFRHYTTIELQ